MRPGKQCSKMQGGFVSLTFCPELSKTVKTRVGPLRIPNGFSDWNELRICISNEVALMWTFGKGTEPSGDRLRGWGLAEEQQAQRQR